MDPLQFLSGRDPVEAVVAMAVSEAVAKQQEHDRKHLAIEIANNVARLFR